jgi:hypothetical protein
MRTQSICLAFVIVLLCPLAFTQSVQTNDLKDLQIGHFSTVGLNVPGRILAESFLHRKQGDVLRWTDSLRAKRMQLPFPNERFIPNGIQRSPRPLRKMSSPQSEIYVIDTAIVRSTTGTTRHLYSFNTNAKRTVDLRQKLMGQLWVDTLRQTNTYDASNNMLSDLWQYWSNGQWLNYYGYTFTYDASGNQLSYLYEQWSSGELVKGYRERCTYDANGNMLSRLGEQWSNGQWVNDYHFTYAYDANGSELSELSEKWSNGQWVYSYHATRTYDTRGNMLSVLGEEWSNGQWVNSWHNTFTYDANGNMLSDLYEEWSNGQWVNYLRRTCTYDTNGRNLTEVNELWSNGQWETVQRWTSTYDAMGNQLNWLHEDWSYSESYARRHTYTYDQDGKVLTLMWEEWLNGQLTKVMWSTRAYDARQNLTSWWGYMWRDFTWAPAHDFWFGCSAIDSAGNTYKFNECHNVSLTYGVILTGVSFGKSELPGCFSLLQNYPNPFNPATTIEFRIQSSQFVTLKVYDLLGREVAVLVDEQKAPGNYEITFDASRLASGVYMYRLTAGQYVESRKMVLIR